MSPTSACHSAFWWAAAFAARSVSRDGKNGEFAANAPLPPAASIRIEFAPLTSESAMRAGTAPRRGRRSALRKGDEGGGSRDRGLVDDSPPLAETRAGSTAFMRTGAAKSGRINSMGIGKTLGRRRRDVSPPVRNAAGPLAQVRAAELAPDLDGGVRRDTRQHRSQNAMPEKQARSRPESDRDAERRVRVPLDVLIEVHRQLGHGGFRAARKVETADASVPVGPARRTVH